MFLNMVLKSVTFEIVDLSKFQVTIVDKDRTLKYSIRY